MKRLWCIALAVLAFKLCLFWGLLNVTGNLFLAACGMLAMKVLVIPGLVVLYMFFKGVFRQDGVGQTGSKSKPLSGKRARKGSSPDKALVSSGKSAN